MLFLLVAYDRIADLAQLRVATADAHAQVVLALERGLHLAPERVLSTAVGPHRHVGQVLALYDDLAHGLVTVGLLIGVWWRCPDVYVRCRRALVSVGLVALVVFVLLPVTPPRLLPGSGVVDVVASSRTWGAWSTSSTVVQHADQYASVPSLHVAWAVWVLLVVLEVGGTGWSRGAAWLHLLLTVGVVLLTGNHYVLDVLLGAALTATVWRAVCGRQERAALIAGGVRPRLCGAVVTRSVRALALVLLGVAVVGCRPGPHDATPGALAAQTSAAAPPSKVLLVVEENAGEDTALARMPFLASLAQHDARAAGYRAASHPSLPNYLALAGGSTFGVQDDGAPDLHPLSGPSVFDQAVARGRTARTYAEGMPAPCDPRSSGRYAARHNPWVYFADDTSRRACRLDDVPAGSTAAGRLHDDVLRGSLPEVGMLVPDLCHDGHDCPLSVADSWLRDWFRVVQKGPDRQSGRLAVVVTFDEAERRGDDVVLCVVATLSSRGGTAVSGLDHLSWTRWADELTGAPPLRHASGAVSLRELLAP